MRKLKTLNEFMDGFKINNESKLNIESVEKSIELVNKIIKTRELLNLSQRELAKISGIKQPALARIESFKTIPKITTLIKIAECLHLSIQALNEREKSIIESSAKEEICNIYTIYYKNMEGSYGSKNQKYVNCN